MFFFFILDEVQRQEWSSQNSMVEKVFAATISQTESIQLILWYIRGVHFENVFSFFLLKVISFLLEANQNKNNCLVSNFLGNLKFPALFSARNRWEKRAGDFNLFKKLLTRQLFLFWFVSNNNLFWNQLQNNLLMKLLLWAE